MYACNQLYSSPMSRREDAAKRLIGGEDGKVDSILVISLLTKQYFISGNVLNPESGGLAWRGGQGQDFESSCSSNISHFERLLIT